MKTPSNKKTLLQKTLLSWVFPHLHTHTTFVVKKIVSKKQKLFLNCFWHIGFLMLLVCVNGKTVLQCFLVCEALNWQQAGKSRQKKNWLWRRPRQICFQFSCFLFNFPSFLRWIALGTLVGCWISIVREIQTKSIVFGWEYLLMLGKSKLYYRYNHLCLNWCLG